MGIDRGEYHLPVESTGPNGRVLRKVCVKGLFINFSGGGGGQNIGGSPVFNECI